MVEFFRDRVEAGRLLAQQVARLGLAAPVVVALPRGGIPVAAQLAQTLHAPLELMIVRKLGAPGQPELAVGAVADADPPEVVLDERLAAITGADRGVLEAAMLQALKEIARRREVYLRGRAQLALEGRDVVVVDDGIATGASMKAALRASRRRKPARLVLAVPVASQESLEELSPLVEQVVCLARPQPFHSVGAHYADFRQVEDDEVLALLDAADAAHREGQREDLGAKSPLGVAATWPRQRRRPLRSP